MRVHMIRLLCYIISYVSVSEGLSGGVSRFIKAELPNNNINC